MSIVNVKSRERNYKLVYIGLVKSGKEANINFILQMTRDEAKGRVLSFTFLGKVIRYYDFILQDITTEEGLIPRFHIYSFDFEEEPHILESCLGGIDGILFVIDSLIEHLHENRRMVETVKDTLRRLGYAPEKFPLVFQFTKRDMDGILPRDALIEEMNIAGSPAIDAVPSTGEGIIESLRLLIEKVVSS